MKLTVPSFEIGFKEVSIYDKVEKAGWMANWVMPIMVLFVIFCAGALLMNRFPDFHWGEERESKRVQSSLEKPESVVNKVKESKKDFTDPEEATNVLIRQVQRLEKHERKRVRKIKLAEAE